MLQNSGTVEIVFLRPIRKRLADLRARQDSVVGALPLQGQLCQMPVVRTGNACAVCIRALMACRAIQRWHALAFRAANDVEEMAVAVIALLWIIRRGMAVNATGVRQHGIDVLPSSKTSFAVSLDRHFLRRSVLSQCTGTCGRPGGAPDQNEYKKPPKHCRTAVYHARPPLRFSRQVCTHIRVILLLERTRSLE